ncbi:hypothetical protein B7486_11745 [cyanobacterium TDX16]|nr:hypothetical protein B7486_11745 [cyanobacterium TDX16]
MVLPLVAPDPGLADVVINEIFMVPDSGPCPCGVPGCEPILPLMEYVELWNRGPGPANLGNWWICDQPTSMNYFRLRQIPQGSGAPFTPAIILAEGDFLVIKFGCQVPFPGYTTQMNASGTITHTTTLPLTVTSDLQIPQTNFSIWDHSAPSNPDFPSFDQPQFIRDFVAWAVGGVYVGAKRGCVAAHPTAGLWPTEIAGDCLTFVPTPEFVAVESGPLLSEPGNSINYSGGSANDPTDYFIAPATQGEANVMPGDLDGDLDMDNDDFALFESCLNNFSLMANTAGQKRGTMTPCVLADLDQSNSVDCKDWPLFVDLWMRYSLLPPPEPSPCPTKCIPGDFNGDTLVDGLDLQGFVDVVLGYDTSPEGACSADMNTDGFADCLDVTPFVHMALAAVPTCLVGDVTGDGVVNGLDIQPFVDSFDRVICGEDQAFCAADTNGDHIIDFADVELFVMALLP